MFLSESRADFPFTVIRWPYASIQLLHAVTGSWRFVHPRGQMAPEEKPRVPFATEVPWLHCYSSSQSSVVIFKHYYDGVMHSVIMV